MLSKSMCHIVSVQDCVNSLLCDSMALYYAICAGLCCYVGVWIWNVKQQARMNEQLRALVNRKYFTLSSVRCCNARYESESSYLLCLQVAYVPCGSRIRTLLQFCQWNSVISWFLFTPFEQAASHSQQFSSRAIILLWVFQPPWSWSRVNAFELSFSFFYEHFMGSFINPHYYEYNWLLNWYQ